jgi:hypothetical protein
MNGIIVIIISLRTFRFFETVLSECLLCFLFRAMLLSLQVTALHFSVHDSFVIIIFYTSTSFVSHAGIKSNNLANADYASQ